MEEQKEFENEVHFHNLCFNTGYLDALCSQIEEVMVKYNPCGIFLDIISPRICYCECCQRDIKALGLNIENEEDMESFRQIVLNKYLDATEKAVRKYIRAPKRFVCEPYNKNEEVLSRSYSKR